MKNSKTIRSLFTMAGFVARARLAGVYGDRYARVIKLQRRKKQPCVRTVDTGAGGVTTNGRAGFVICPWRTGGFTWSSALIKY